MIHPICQLSTTELNGTQTSYLEPTH